MILGYNCGLIILVDLFILLGLVVWFRVLGNNTLLGLANGLPGYFIGFWFGLEGQGPSVWLAIFFWAKIIY